MESVKILDFFLNPENDVDLSQYLITSSFGQRQLDGQTDESTYP